MQKLYSKISDSQFKQDIDAHKQDIDDPTLSLSLFLFSFFLPLYLSRFIARYRNRSFNLKTAFHAFKLHAKVASSIPFLLFIPRVSSLALSSTDFFLFLLLSPRLPSPVPSIFSRGSSIRLHSSHRKRGSFESLLSFLVFHGLMLPDQHVSLLGFRFI